MIKTLLNLIFISLISSFGCVLAQKPQTYVSFDKDTLNLFAYEGTKTMILSNTSNRDSLTMKKWVESMDGAYAYYTTCTGREPNYYTEFTHLNDLSTIARVDRTCGAACGYIGWTGIEIMNTFFDRFYDDLKNRGEYGQEPFYEFGRNFWFYSDQLEYTENDPIVTGYAVFMRFMAMDYLQLKGSKFWSWTFDEFRNEVKGLLRTYLADTSYTWQSTLGKGAGLRNTQLGATDLFASFCFYMFDNHGGHEWVKAVWKEAETLPKKNTTQDAVDNFIIASSRAAKQNLIPLFTEWRWPISQKVREELQSLPLSVHETTDKLYPYPNPVSRNGVITFSNSAIQQCRLIDLHGKRFELQAIAPCTFSIGNVPAGIYMVQFNNDFELPHSAICIQD